MACGYRLANLLMEVRQYIKFHSTTENNHSCLTMLLRLYSTRCQFSVDKQVDENYIPINLLIIALMGWRFK